MFSVEKLLFFRLFFFPGKTFRTNYRGNGQKIGRLVAK